MKSTGSNEYSDTMLTRAILAIGLTWIGAALTTATAQEETKPLRPVTAAYTIEAGGSSIANTYLTPLKYAGWGTALQYERMQAMKQNPDRLVMRLTAGVRFDRVENEVKNAEMWHLKGNFSWGAAYRWRLPHNITVGAGGSTALNIGALYAPRNGNNPVAIEAALTLNATGYAAWHVKLGRIPVTLRYQPTLPLTGVFFSPEYGELLYEVYLGNDKGLAHAAWWGNYFNLDNLLTADIHFGATCLRVGYHGEILSTKVNNITTRTITNAVVVGVSGEWLSFNPYKGLSREARIISALY